MSFAGKFKLDSQDHFDDYLKAIGVGMAQRLVAKAATPVVTYNVSGDEWTVLTTGLKDTTMKFKIGVEQDDETPDGRKVKNVFSMDGANKIVQHEKWDGKTATYIREINGDNLTVTINLGDVCCVRRYKRV